MRELLIVCTTKTPFEFLNQTYVQLDGVSMGSPLGPTFADYYMSDLENHLLRDNKKASNPKFYRRYVDDIIAVFNNKQHVTFFKQRLKRASVLNFTHEEMTDNTFHFLDVQLTLNTNRKLSTTVYIKPTDQGSYSNFLGHSPLIYKKSVAKALIQRCLRYSSDWQACSKELNRIKQVLANNHYPQSLTEELIRTTLNKYINPTETIDKQNNITFYVQLHNLAGFINDKRILKSIVKEHVKSTDMEKCVNITAYFKPIKLKSCFPTRQRSETLQTSHVVYRFRCPRDGCNAAYIGYSSCALERRAKQHRYKGSSIHEHFLTDHNTEPPPADLHNNFEIIYKSHDVSSLRIAEAILIKTHNPYINVKFNEMSNFLNVYK